MHSDFTYTYEAVAEEISAFLRGSEGPPRRRRMPEHGPTACYVPQWAGFEPEYVDGQTYRAWLIAKKVLTPDVGTPLLKMDAWAHAEADRELADYDEHGAYADRGICIANGRVRYAGQPRDEEQDNDEAS